MNQFKIEQICLTMLELTEIPTSSKDRTRFENKWILEASKVDDYSLGKVSKMVLEAFKVLNTIIKLALVDDDAA